MKVNELVQELQKLDNPNLAVYVPCPHCCGQRGTDFDLLDAEFVLTIERNGQQVAVLGDPGQDCIGDKRMDNRYRVEDKVSRDASRMVQELGLHYVGIVHWQTLRKRLQTLDAGEGQRREREFLNLRRSNLIVEATDGDATHYIIVETPFRAFVADIGRVLRNAEVIARITGCATHAVIACVRRDSSLNERELPSNVHWHMVDEADLVPE